jgi:kinetochore protein Nuf2
MATGRTPAPKSAFSFPELKVTDIVASLLELGVTGLKDKDLMEPKSEVVQKVYEHLVHGLMFKTKEEMSQPNFEGLQEIVYMVRW